MSGETEMVLRQRVDSALDETHREIDAPPRRPTGIRATEEWREGWAEGYTAACVTIRAVLSPPVSSVLPVGQVNP